MSLNTLHPHGTTRRATVTAIGPAFNEWFRTVHLRFDDGEECRMAERTDALLGLENRLTLEYVRTGKETGYWRRQP